MKKILAVVLLILCVWVWYTQEYLYFYGNWCSHCANVDAYMTSVDGYNKINITKKEVFWDKNNAKEMDEYGTKLWIDPMKLWVPFLVIMSWDNTDYLIWDEPIINYFKPILWEWSTSWWSDNKRIVVISILLLIAVVIVLWVLKWWKDTKK